MTIKIGNVSAKILCDSINDLGDRLTTFELEMPKCLLAELNTFRLRSSNASSCLHGDVEIYTDTPTATNNGNKKKYTIKLSDLYNRWVGIQEFSTVGVMKKINLVSSFEPNKLYSFFEIGDKISKNNKSVRQLLAKKTKDNATEKYLIKSYFVDNLTKFLGKDIEDFIINRNNSIDDGTGYTRVTGSLSKMISNINVRCVNENTNEIIHTKIKDVIYSGKKDIYEITTKSGYTIKCSKEHNIFSNMGWISLDTIGLKKLDGRDDCAFERGVYIACNGELAYKNYDWVISQKNAGKTIRQISDENAWSYKKIAEYIRTKHKIPFKKTVYTPNESFEYTDQIWLNTMRNNGYTCGYIANICNTTEDRVKKMCKKHNIIAPVGVILSNGSNRIPWNTGLTYKMSPATHAAYLEKIKNRTKINSPNWKGGYEQAINSDIQKAKVIFMNSYRKKLIVENKFKCCVTGNTKNLHIHHIDPIWNNPDRIFDESNLIPMSDYIHRKLHANNLDITFKNWIESGYDPINFDFGKYDTCIYPEKKRIKNKFAVKFDEIVSVKYVGYDDVYDIEVDGPYHNFIANGICVHNSRAIPTTSFIEIESFEPKKWLQNQSGMQAKNEEIEDIDVARQIWYDTIEYCKNASIELNKLKLHKQHANRPNDWHVMAKVVLSATELDNFYWLRIAEDAQPEMNELASLMKNAQNNSIPQLLKPGQWHLPYVDTKIINDIQYYYDDTGKEISLHNAQMISASSNAQVSYRKLNTSLEKADDIFFKLIYGTSKPHFSPTEHLATPISEDNWTHMYKDGSKWSGNFCGWAQYRHFGIPELLATHNLQVSA